MPILIAVVVVALLGVGAYLFIGQAPSETNQPLPAETARPEETVRSEERQVTPPEAPTSDVPSEPEEADPVLESDAAVEVDTDVDLDSEPAAPQTIEASATYLTPRRTEHSIDVVFTVADGVVTDSEVVYDRSAGFSNSHQERFDAAYKAEVVGQPLENISLSRVGGASLTSDAFNEAVAQANAQLEA